MTNTEELYNLAKENGYDGRLFSKNGSEFLDREFWMAITIGLGWDTGAKIRMCTGCGVALRNSEKPTMDGKHGGKKGCGSDIYEYEGQWLIEWHRFIDALAEGGSIEDYAGKLLSK